MLTRRVHPRRVFVPAISVFFPRHGRLYMNDNNKKIVYPVLRFCVPELCTAPRPGSGSPLKRKTLQGFKPQGAMLILRRERDSNPW